MNPRGAQKKCERILEGPPVGLDEVPPGDWVEMDEHGHARVTACIRQSPSLWLWVAVSHLTRLVLGFVISDRSDDALWRLVDEELHWAWRDALVRTDGWEGYQRLLPAEQHQVCGKGSGLTSIVEALNCKSGECCIRRGGRPSRRWRASPAACPGASWTT